MVCSVHAVNADSDLAPIMSLGPLNEAYGTPRLAVTHLRPVDLREFLRKTVVQAKTGCPLLKEP